MPSLGIGSCGGGVSCALANPDKKRKMNGATAEARREKPAIIGSSSYWRF